MSKRMMAMVVAVAIGMVQPAMGRPDCPRARREKGSPCTGTG
jgi:hypothetical protein